MSKHLVLDRVVRGQTQPADVGIESLHLRRETDDVCLKLGDRGGRLNQSKAEPGRGDGEEDDRTSKLIEHA